MLAFRFLAKLCVAIGLLQAHAALAQGSGPQKVSFYFAAHQDDWQLFMNPSAFVDVTESDTKTVFVHLTAGDAGSGKTNRERKHPFYAAREHGAEAAIRFMADQDNLPVEKTAVRQFINGHAIQRVSYRNTVTYFLRLPDGHPSGSGFRETGYQSLERFANGKIETLTAIDDSSVYRGWQDLVTMLRAIVDEERGVSPSVQLNVAELDPRINPDDHSDHLMTAKAALEAASGLSCARRLHYVDYASARLPENLSPQQRDMEAAVFAVTSAGIRALDHATAWRRYDRSYVGRNYFRVEEGIGGCEAPARGHLQAIAGRPKNTNPTDR